MEIESVCLPSDQAESMILNFLIRDLPDVKMPPNFQKTHRFGTFQSFDPENSVTFSEIFWTDLLSI